MVGDEVAERVEPGLPDGLEGLVPGSQSRPAAVGDLGQQRAAEAVALERAVPDGAEHDPGAAAPSGRRRLAALAASMRPWWIS